MIFTTSINTSENKEVCILHIVYCYLYPHEFNTINIKYYTLHQSIEFLCK